MKQLSIAIHTALGEKKKHLACYQTSIAIGGYLGPRAKELLQFTWHHVINKKEKDLYEFKTEKNRKVYYNNKLLQLVKANFQIIDPINVHDFILASNELNKPITTRAFNKSFKHILKQYSIETDNPSSHTLRKTFAYRVFKNEGGDESALIFVSEILAHSTLKVTRKYLGITQNALKKAYLTMD